MGGVKSAQIRYPSFQGILIYFLDVYYDTTHWSITQNPSIQIFSDVLAQTYQFLFTPPLPCP